MSLSLQRITHQSLHRFPDKTEDANNITKISRKLDDYFELVDEAIPFAFGMEQFLNERTGQTKIRVLDCGAGEGIALHDLLSSRFKSQIQKVTGVSLHAFDGVRAVLALYGQRIDWFLGDAVKVLSKLPSEYDLLTDIWGSYFYSDNRVKLIKAMHGVLKSGGRAYIYLGPLHLSPVNSIDYKGEKIWLEQHLERKYPETFRFFDETKSVFVITKTSQRCPSIDFEATDVSYDSSVDSFSESEAIAGNAWYPKHIAFKEIPDSRRLRSLPYQKSSSEEESTHKRQKINEA